MQKFFDRNRSKGIWAPTEVRALWFFFFDNRERLRSSAPPEKWVVETLESQLVKSYGPQIQRKEERAHAAARRALEEGLQKLRERVEEFAAEEIRRANSLVITGLDDVVIRLLRAAGYQTRRQVALALDRQLLQIPGIDRARLRQIRKYCPHVSERTDRRLARARSGQASLF
ncbi:MAG: hypothetical protein NUV85_04035 [Candidatus Berkelbacteria bacterium]|nr:hypothetical protein [Candidatus Berkelbacteria bacterium]